METRLRERGKVGKASSPAAAHSLPLSCSLTHTRTHAPLRLLWDAHPAAREEELADGRIEREDVDAVAEGEDELCRRAV